MTKHNNSSSSTTSIYPTLTAALLLRFIFTTAATSSSSFHQIIFQNQTYNIHQILECGVVLHQWNNNNNNNNVCHIPPLIVHTVLLLFEYKFLYRLVVALVDVGVGYFIFKLGREVLGIEEEFVSTIENMDSKIRPPNYWLIRYYESNDDDNLNDNNDKQQQKSAVVMWKTLPYVSACLYLFNPLLIMNQSLYSLAIVCQLNSLLFMLQNDDLVMSSFLWSLAMVLDVYSSLLCWLPPLLLLCGFNFKSNKQHLYSRNNNHNIFKINKRRMKDFMKYCGLWLSSLMILSMTMSGGSSLKTLLASYGWSLSFQDLSPNVGLVWYFFTMMFEKFKLYYVVMMNGMPLLCISPVVIRLYRYPIAVATILCLVAFIFKGSPTINDIALPLSMICLCPFALVRMRECSVFALIAMPVTISLITVGHWLWVVIGSGNANYIFFQCLATLVFCVVLLFDFTAASMKHDKAVRLIGYKKKMPAVNDASASSPPPSKEAKTYVPNIEQNGNHNKND